MKHVQAPGHCFTYSAMPFPAFRCVTPEGAAVMTLGLVHVEPETSYLVRVNNGSTVGTATTNEQAIQMRDRYNQASECSQAEIVEVHTLPEGGFRIARLPSGKFVAINQEDASTRSLVFIGYENRSTAGMVLEEARSEGVIVLNAAITATGNSNRIDLMAIMETGQSIVLSLSDRGRTPRFVVLKLTQQGIQIAEVSEHEIELFMSVCGVASGVLPDGAVLV